MNIEVVTALENLNKMKKKISIFLYINACIYLHIQSSRKKFVYKIRNYSIWSLFCTTICKHNVEQESINIISTLIEVQESDLK